MTRARAVAAILLTCALGTVVQAAEAARAEDSARVEIAGPSEESAVPAALRALLADAGMRVVLDGKPAIELWLPKHIPEATGDLGKLGVVYPYLPEGTLVGVARFHDRWLDFRGKPVPAGTYTLRYSIQPTDGNHSGVSDFRDYLVLVPASADPGERVVADVKALMALGKKATGTNHPAVMSLVPPPKEAKAPSVVAGPRDLVTLIAACGERTLGIVVRGKVETENE